MKKPRDRASRGLERPPHRAAVVTLSAGDLAGLEARRADVEALGSSIHDRPNALDVGVEAALGPAVGVRDVVPETRTLGAEVADGSHGVLLNRS
jgi:hypothetical protein